MFIVILFSWQSLKINTSTLASTVTVSVTVVGVFCLHR